MGQSPDEIGVWGRIRVDARQRRRRLAQIAVERAVDGVDLAVTRRGGRLRHDARGDVNERVGGHLDGRERARRHAAEDGRAEGRPLRRAW